MCRFIKFIPSDESMDLVRKYPNAFVLLTIIAERARRENGRPDGLIAGDALIDSCDLEPGLSRQNFRTALAKLVELGQVEIIDNGKGFLKKNEKREKSTIKVTIKGMLVNLCSSTIYDINSEEANQRSNQQLTNDQPTANHKEERRRKKKKEKEDLPIAPSLPKIKFRELVELTQVQHDSLLAQNGKEFCDRMFDKSDAYQGSTGKKYDSDYHTMTKGGWVYKSVKKEMEEETLKRGASTTQQNDAHQAAVEDKKLAEATRIKENMAWMKQRYRSKDDERIVILTHGASFKINNAGESWRENVPYDDENFKQRCLTSETNLWSR